MSVSGTGEVVEDRDKIQEVWSTDMDAWFPQRPDNWELSDQVNGESAEFSDGPAAGVCIVVSLVMAEATSERYDANDHDTGDLRPAGFVRTDDCP